MVDVNWGELGFVALFIVYLIYQGKVQANQETVRQERIEQNHESWQKWLSSEREAAIRAQQALQATLMAHLDEWRLAMDAREAQRQVGYQDMLRMIDKLESQIEHMNSITLLVYAAIQAPGVVDTMREAAEGRRKEGRR
jgi:hypothetical protein